MQIKVMKGDAEIYVVPVIIADVLCGVQITGDSRSEPAEIKQIVGGPLLLATPCGTDFFLSEVEQLALGLAVITAARHKFNGHKTSAIPLDAPDDDMATYVDHMVVRVLNMFQNIASDKNPIDIDDRVADAEVFALRLIDCLTQALRIRRARSFSAGIERIMAVYTRWKSNSRSAIAASPA